MALITDRSEDTLEDRTTYERINGDVIEGRPTRLPPQGTRVRWGGVMSGFFESLAVCKLLNFRYPLFRFCLHNGPVALTL
jgi:hypothetical protein